MFSIITTYNPISAYVIYSILCILLNTLSNPETCQFTV